VRNSFAAVQPVTFAPARTGHVYQALYHLPHGRLIEEQALDAGTRKHIPWTRGQPSQVRTIKSGNTNDDFYVYDYPSRCPLRKTFPPAGRPDGTSTGWPILPRYRILVMSGRMGALACWRTLSYL
jgi:hypothetical protein